MYGVDKAILTVKGLMRAREHDVGVVFCGTAHHAIPGLVIAKIRGVRCVWESHGNGRLFYESLGRGRLSVFLVTLLERFLGTRVDDLITVSKADAAAYSRMGLPASKIHVRPLSVSVKGIDAAVGPEAIVRAPPDAKPPVLLFFGSFSYEPNREALQFVNDTLAPRLEAAGIRCEIQIAGRDIPTLRFHPLVRPIGFVPDIYSHIRAADVCIVPVRRGVGVLTKVIDTMAVGTPVVLPDFAAQGIPEIRSGVHAYVADSDEQFLRAVEHALSHPEAAREMSRRARDLVEERFDWDRYTGELDAIVRGSGVLAGGGGAS